MRIQAVWLPIPLGVASGSTRSPRLSLCLPLFPVARTTSVWLLGAWLWSPSPLSQHCWAPKPSPAREGAVILVSVRWVLPCLCTQWSTRGSPRGLKEEDRQVQQFGNLWTGHR